MPAFNSFTSDEEELFKIYSDKVLFARVVIGMEERWYQSEILRDPSKRKVLRCGRRVGKTTSMIADMLHASFTTERCRCLVIAPYDSYIESIFEELRRWIAGSEVLDASVVSSSRNPQRIQFGNGSFIRGFTAGTRSGGKGNSARSWGADRLYMDEVDYLSDEDIDSIMGLALERPDIPVMAASTPTGKRGKFYQWCHSPDIWKEFHFPSQVNPNWTEEMDRQARLDFTPDGYIHEVLAEFGQEVTGVYPKERIDAARVTYSYVRKRDDFSAPCAIGVDFDKYGAGTQIAVVEFRDGKFKTLLRVEIPKSEYTYDNAIKKIIDLNDAFRPEVICLDAGAGEYQVESLRLYGRDHPETGLKEKVKRIAFGSTIEVPDPVTRVVTRQPLKPHMVNMAVIAFERDMVMLNDEDVTLWRQLENYNVVRTSASGQPVYTDENEHAHDAWLLALHGIMTAHPDIMRVVHNITPSTRIISVSAKRLLEPRIGPVEDRSMRVVPLTDEPRLSGLVRVAHRSSPRFTSRRLGPSHMPRRSFW